MRFHSWMTSESTAPSVQGGEQGSRSYPVSGADVAEATKRCIEAGGSSAELLNDLNAGLPDGVSASDELTLLNANGRFSGEFWFYHVMAIKRILSSVVSSHDVSITIKGGRLKFVMMRKTDYPYEVMCGYEKSCLDSANRVLVASFLYGTLAESRRDEAKKFIKGISFAERRISFCVRIEPSPSPSPYLIGLAASVALTLGIFIALPNNPWMRFGALSLLIALCCNAFLFLSRSQLSKKLLEFEKSLELKAVEEERILTETRDVSRHLLREKLALEDRVAERTEALRAANVELEAMNEARMAFFANVSHELKTPVTLVSSPLHALREGEYGDSIPRDHPVFALMARNLDRLSVMTGKMLDIARLELGGWNHRSLIALDRTLYNWLSVWNEAYRLKGLRLIVEDGLFKRYGHLHSFMLGTGLGLALSREIAVLHRGSLECQSKEGLGSTFRLRLPVCPETELIGGQDLRARVFAAARTVMTIEKSIETETRDSQLKRAARPRALIVEDQTDMASYLASGLGRDFEVCVVDSGLSALMALDRGGRPAVILSDLMMPGMDGLELLGRLISDERFSDIPFIMLTAWNEPEMRDRALDAGARAFLQKPFTMSELRKTMADAAGLAPYAAVDQSDTRETWVESPEGEAEGAERSGVRLSDREKEIALLVLQGLCDKEIGSRLHVSTRTISNTLQRVYRKTGVSSRVQLLRVFSSATPSSNIRP